MSDATGAAAQATADSTTDTTTGTEQGQQTTDAGQQGQAQAGEQQGQQGQQQGQAPQAPDMTGWPEEARKAYERRDADAKRYQREAGDARVHTRDAARADERKGILAELAKVLDPDAAANSEPTVESVTTQLQAATAERDNARREAATVLAAVDAGVDPAKLDYLHYKLGRTDFASLDPADAEFSAKVKAAVDAQVSADQTLRAAGTAQVSGVESTGGAGDTSAISQERFNSMNMLDRADLRRRDPAAYERLVAGQ